MTASVAFPKFLFLSWDSSLAPDHLRRRLLSPVFLSRFCPEVGRPCCFCSLAPEMMWAWIAWRCAEPLRVLIFLNPQLLFLPLLPPLFWVIIWISKLRGPKLLAHPVFSHLLISPSYIKVCHLCPKTVSQPKHPFSCCFEMGLLPGSGLSFTCGS